MHLFELSLRDYEDQIKHSEELLGKPSESDGIIVKYFFPSEQALNAAINTLFASKHLFVIDVISKHRVER